MCGAVLRVMCLCVVCFGVCSFVRLRVCTFALLRFCTFRFCASLRFCDPGVLELRRRRGYERRASGIDGFQKTPRGFVAGRLTTSPLRSGLKK